MSAATPATNNPALEAALKKLIEDITTAVKTFGQGIVTTGGGGTTEPDPIPKPSDTTTPTPPPPPQKPLEPGEILAHFKPNPDPMSWDVTKMTKSGWEGKWKIVDAKGNVAIHNISSEAMANEILNYIQFNYNKPSIPPTPTPATETSVAKNGVNVMATIKEGGQQQFEYKVERSTHSGKTRDSLYGEPKLNNNDAVNFAEFVYTRVDLSTKDQYVFKTLGGEHNDSNPKRGQCYCVGLEIEPGRPTIAYLAKETPKHPETPRFLNRMVQSGLELPDLNNKTFGLQVVGFVTPNKTYIVRCYIDLSVQDVAVEGLPPKPPNQWKLLFTAEDKGDWSGAPFLQNNGKVNGGQCMFIYGRVDNVKQQTATQAKFAGAVEIVPPTA
jgi:hypothetical protein